MTSTTSPGRGRGSLASAGALLLVASAAVAGVSLVAAGTATAAPTGISDCTVVDEPGTYELTSNVSPNDPADDGPCIAVRADDVSLDGNGHAVDLGDANGSGIVVGASGAAAVANVTVRDVTVRAGDGATGVAYRNVTGGVVANVTAEAGRSLRVDGGEGVTVRDSAFTSVDAAALRVTADDATVVGNDVRVISTSNLEGDDSIGGLSVGGSNGTVRGNAVDVTNLEGVYTDYDYGVRVGGSNYTVVDNEVTGEATVGIVVGGSDNVVSSNDVSEEIRTGVAVRGSDNTFSDTYTTTTLLVNGTGILVEDVAIVHAYDGVQAEGSDNAFVNVTLVDISRDAMDIRGSNTTVTDLTVSDSDGGIDIRGSNNTVSDSTVEQVYAVGISVDGSNNTVSDNTASENGDGMSVDGSNNTVSDNTASENRRFGFSIDGSNNTVSDNTASENRESGFSVRGSNTTVVGNDASDSDRGIVVYGDGHTVRSNRIHNATEVGVFAQGNRTLVYDNLVETAAGGEPAVAVDRSAIVVGRGPGQGKTVGMRVYHSNAWNVTARSGGNVVGGSTTGGNYYAVVNGTGFSEACRDVDRDGVCDDPNVLSLNHTDHLPLADDTNASVGYLEVTDVDAPPRFERGEAETVTVDVTNVGTETVTQSVAVTSSYRYATVESSPARRTVTLAPGETTSVTFDVVADSRGGLLSLVPVSVSSANATLTARVHLVEPQPSFYQVDFVAGDPIENLSVVNLYAQDDRLFQYAFGEADEGITSRGSAWENETLRECVDHGAITDNGNGTASVTFTVAENCSSRAFSLAVYSMPGAEFSLSTVDQQELLNATTETYGPGEHTITVDLPDGTDGDD